MYSDRDALYALLGDLPPRDRPVDAEFVDEQDRGSYILEILTLDLNGIEPVPAYFVKPKNASGPRPTILYNHAHGGEYKLGKEELVSGRPALQNPPYAEVLTSMGYNALCIDTWCFGHRWGRTESAIFKEMLWRGQVLWGMMVYDSIKAVDYLCTREDVDKSRIGTLGLSMGSTMAWWTAALDERISCCVDICCLTDFHALIDVRGLDSHGLYYYVPGLLKEWTTAKINALIAPRPHLALAGIYDILTPVHGLDRIDAELRRVYESLGASDAWKLVRYPCGHVETHAMRKEVVRWLKKWMG
ncbi:MAG: acetylxylan esterase [Armatimonadota bacterium]|nr:acetylxylan esterase [Armatimonadota bacterium]